MALEKNVFENTSWKAPIVEDEIQMSDCESIVNSEKLQNSKVSQITSPTLPIENDRSTEKNSIGIVHRLPIWPSTSFAEFEMTLDMKQECIDACNRQCKNVFNKISFNEE